MSTKLGAIQSAPGRPNPVKITSVTNVGHGGAIYEVLYDSGGATVPVVYRYFLMNLQPGDEEALQEAKKTAPFLVTKSSAAVREVLDDRVKLKVDGVIYGFHNISLFKVDGEINIVKFDLDSTAP
ncbi:hypothetical protein [Pseudomonas fragi]|uniref:hypothetical protein n=2 Tax=Pseudomonas TaxID=286 RepID=UPI0015CD1191|nr:hypothetical protein [Pseudomonas fragi]